MDGGNPAARFGRRFAAFAAAILRAGVTRADDLVERAMETAQLSLLTEAIVRTSRLSSGRHRKSCLSKRWQTRINSRVYRGVESADSPPAQRRRRQMAAAATKGTR